VPLTWGGFQINRRSPIEWPHDCLLGGRTMRPPAVGGASGEQSNRHWDDDTPIVAIAKTLKQASSPVAVQARTPAPGRPALRHSPYPATAAAAKGAPATSMARHPLTPIRVADPLVMVPGLKTLCD
jgi:hypothetical protein